MSQYIYQTKSEMEAVYLRNLQAAWRDRQETHPATTVAGKSEMSPSATQVPSDPSRGTRPAQKAGQVGSYQKCEFQPRVFALVGAGLQLMRQRDHNLGRLRTNRHHLPSLGIRRGGSSLQGAQEGMMRLSAAQLPRGRSLNPSKGGLIKRRPSKPSRNGTGMLVGPIMIRPGRTMGAPPSGSSRGDQ